MPIFRGCLNDFDRMPIGKWKGELLMDVPQGYFRWLRDQEWLSQFPALEKYVTSRNWDGGEDEFKSND